MTELFLVMINANTCLASTGRSCTIERMGSGVLRSDRDIDLYGFWLESAFQPHGQDLVVVRGYATVSNTHSSTSGSASTRSDACSGAACLPRYRKPEVRDTRQVQLFPLL